MNKSKLPGLLLLALFMGALASLMWKNADTGSHKTILFITADSKAEAIIKGTDLFYQQYPDLAKQIDVVVRTKSNLEEGQAPPASDILVFHVHETDLVKQQEAYLKSINSAFVTQAGTPGTRIATGQPGLKYSEEQIADLGLTRDKLTEQFVENGSPQDIKKLIVYLLNRFEGYSHLEMELPQKLPDVGYVAFRNNQILAYDTTWQDWVRHTHPDKNKPLVAYLINRSYAHQQLLNIERSVMARMEKAGMQPVLVFGYPGSVMVKKLLIDQQGKPRIRAAIAGVFKFSDNEALQYLEQMDVPVLNAIDLYGPTIAEWQASAKGLSSNEVAWQLAMPELLGLAPHTVIGGTDFNGDITVKQPIAALVGKIVGRTARLLYLQNTPRPKKKIGVLYWNYPPGKDNIGASYLNVLSSIPTLLTDLRHQGYTLTGYSPSNTKSLQELIKKRGRNVGRYAPGELQSMVAEGGSELIPVSTYRKWFDKLPVSFKKLVLDHWGPPEKADIMTIRKNGELHFVLPMIRFGNVYVMPQADRARTQDIAALYHSNTLPPHHQYIAQYLWLQRNTDVLIHTGTHGSQEWLDGKESGLSESDSPEVLIGDLPVMYLYNMDVVGEGIVAKRRGAATIIDHLTPALGEAGLSPELKKLNGMVKKWEKSQTLDPDGAKKVLDDMYVLVQKMGIDKDLAKNGWKPADVLTTKPEAYKQQMVEELQHYIEAIREHATPLGLHTFGVSPADRQLKKFAAIILSGNPKGNILEYTGKLEACGPEELRALAEGLDGRFVSPGTGNDPIRNPMSLPTGKNFYSFDPRMIPDAYADTTARQLAGNFIANFKKEHKKYPEKVALEVWGTETIRHQGIQEAQGLALMGLRIVRDKMGKVEDVELIPRQELGRPRVDVLYSISGLYRDNFPMVADLIDKGVALAASSPEQDNAVRKHSQAVYDQLVKAGMDTAMARKRSLVRCFSQPPGVYGNRVADAQYASGTWDKEDQVADLYIQMSGYGYGQGLHGEKMTDEFKAALSGTDAIIHSRSSSLYMSLDNDDFAAYAGAIAMGVRRVDGGKSPPLLVADLRQKGREQYVSLEKFMGMELRSRYFNPDYIKAMQGEGYAGAKILRESVDNLWHWAVSYPEVVNAEKWEEFYEIYLKDRYALEMEAFFQQNSPHARESMTARMMEAVRKGYWQPSAAIKKDLARIYVQNVAKNGVGCNHTTCDHPELQQYIKGVAETNSDIKASDVQQWLKNLEDATGKTIDKALADRKAAKGKWKDPDSYARENQKVAKDKEIRREKVQGYKMEEEKIITSVVNAPSHPFPWMTFSLIGIQLFIMIMGGLKRRY